jgi:hypothetical protein
MCRRRNQRRAGLTVRKELIKRGWKDVSAEGEPRTPDRAKSLLLLVSRSLRCNVSLEQRVAVSGIFPTSVERPKESLSDVQPFPSTRYTAV